MSIATVYIRAKSKADAKRRLAAGEDLVCHMFDFFHGDHDMFWSEVAEGTVVKIFSEIVGGSPYAKAYGNKKKMKLV